MRGFRRPGEWDLAVIELGSLAANDLLYESDPFWSPYEREQRIANRAFTAFLFAHGWGEVA